MEPIEFITPSNLPKVYLLHFFTIQFGLFLICCLASFKIRITENQRIREQEAQSRKLKMQSIVCDRHPFIVFQKKPSKADDSKQESEEENYQISFISDACTKEIKALVGTS